MAAFSMVWGLPVVYVLYLVYKILRFGHREKNLPPGPPTFPGIGNVHQIPSRNLYRKFKEWSDQYGSAYSLKVGKSTFIVLNDREAVHDLLIKRSAIYSERPSDTQGKVSFGDENLAMMGATPLWRAQRKITSQMLAPSRLDGDFTNIQEAEINHLMNDLLNTPDDFRQHMKRTTSSVASIVLFGHRAISYESFWAKTVYHNMDLINKAIEPGSYLPVDQFPLLSWIPSALLPLNGIARAHECFNTVTSNWGKARQRVEQRRSTGDKRDSLIDRLLSEDIKPDVPFSYTQTNNFVGAVHQGAADTTSAAMLTNILYLAKYPQFQDKARVELDRVCHDRMPLWTDFQDLPYINCIIKEGLRIRPVVPAGVPHRVKQDDMYRGMLIPRDAVVFAPSWALNHTYFDEPETYNPDRYLNHPKLAMDYAGSADYENRDHYAYGAGRRICVGIHLAERTQWRITARMLWAFNIEPAIDEVTSEKIELDIDAYEDGMTAEPKPFRVKFTPRSEKHAEVIRRDFKEVQDFLKTWE